MHTSNHIRSTAYPYAHAPLPHAHGAGRVGGHRAPVGLGGAGSPHQQGPPVGASPCTPDPWVAMTFGTVDPHISLYFFILTFVVQSSCGEETATWKNLNNDQTTV